MLRIMTGALVLALTAPAIPHRHLFSTAIGTAITCPTDERLPIGE